VLATLIRLLGDFDVAEEALHDAFRAALEQWPKRWRAGKSSAWRCRRPLQGDRRCPAAERFDALDDVGRRRTGSRRHAAWADEESVRTISSG